MATYVLVHGGGHGGWCYQKVARLLRAAGHEVYTPTLTGLGERSHLLAPGDRPRPPHPRRRAVLQYEDLHDVILVGHSYGGMVITGVADRAADRIGRLVYLDAANPVNGQSLVDVAGPMIEITRPARRGGRRRRARAAARARRGPRSTASPIPTTSRGWTSASPAPVGVLRAEARAHERGRAVGDPAVPHRVHLDLADPRPGADGRGRAPTGRFWEIDTGHDLMITEPEFVADALVQVAQSR